MKFKNIFRMFSAEPTPRTEILTRYLNQTNLSGDAALQITAVRAAVNAIASELSSVSIFTYERTTNGRETATNHPSYKLIHDRPNDLYTIDVYLRLIGVDLCLNGNHYAYVLRSGTKPVGLVRIDPRKVTPKIIQGSLLYEVQFSKGVEFVSPWNIIHVRGLSTDGIVGLSPIDSAKRAITLANNTETLGEKYFERGLIGHQLIKHPAKLTDTRAKQLKEDIQKNYAGESNAFGHILLEEGMSIETQTLNMEQIQWLQSRQYNKNDIASGIFGVPPPFYGDYTNLSQYGTMGNVSTMFYKNCIRPILISIENEFSSKLLTEDERDRFYIEASIESLLRGSPSEQVEIWSKQISMGTLLKDEVREMQNLAPIYGPLSTQTNIPRVADTASAELEELNKFSQEIKNEQREIREDLSELKTAIENTLSQISKIPAEIDTKTLIDDCSRRVQTKELNAVKRAAKKFLQDDPKTNEFLEWAKDFYSEHMETTENTFKPIVYSVFADDKLNQMEEAIQANQFGLEVCEKACECETPFEAVSHYVETLEAKWR